MLQENFASGDITWLRKKVRALQKERETKDQTERQWEWHSTLMPVWAWVLS